ncbi:MAG: MotA/TolQ/ExbB proton channel family protein [Verrucomicrobia bacterium]|nr:MotA/TolQ/ExbB proton channel family protein [Verrucomicrobiota bacterium]
MKHLILCAFLVPLLSVHAEDSDLFSHECSFEEEAALESLDRELTLLDEEFEEFKEELFSLEQDLVAEDQTYVEAPEAMPEAVPFVLTEQIQEPAYEAEQPGHIITFSQPEAKSTEAVASNAAVDLVTKPMKKSETIVVDFKKAFSGAPLIYTLLLGMSVFAVGIWLYALFSLKLSVRISDSLLRNLQGKLNSNQFAEALLLCNQANNLFSKMVASGILSRRHGLSMMVETMRTEGKRASIGFWQKINLLNDIAVIAPMLGLLGTVLGMFYAFYDVNRSMESITTLFDGLGVSVGTTVAGLIVAILALILHSTAKFRLVKALTYVENEAQHVVTLIDDRTSIYKG